MAEKRKYVTMRNPDYRHVAIKRMKLNPSNHGNPQWIDQGSFERLIKERDDFCRALNRIYGILSRHPSKKQAIKYLEPLGPYFEEDTSRIDGDDYTLAFSIILADIVFVLDAIVYNIGDFRHLQKNNAQVPRTVHYNLDISEDWQVERARSFLSFPALASVLNIILRFEDTETSHEEISVSFMDRAVLDIQAVQHKMPIPSFISCKGFHRGILKIFPPPSRVYVSDSEVMLEESTEETKKPLLSLREQAELAGEEYEPIDLNAQALAIFPWMVFEDKPSEPEEKEKPSGPEEEERPSGQEAKGPLPFQFRKPRLNPPPAIDRRPLRQSRLTAAKAGTRRIARLHADHLESRIYGIPSTQARIASYRKIGAFSPPVTKVEPKEPPKCDESEANQSILRRRYGSHSWLIPKRSTSTMNKEVRFSENVAQIPTDVSGYGRFGRTGRTVVHKVSSSLSSLRDGRGWPSASSETKKERQMDMGYCSLEDEQRIFRPRPLRAVAKWLHRKDPCTEDDPAARIEEIFNAPTIEPLFTSDYIQTFLARRRVEKLHEASRATSSQRVMEWIGSKDLTPPKQRLAVPLSDKWSALVDSSLTYPYRTLLAITGEKRQLKRRDFETLVPPMAWLNDEIVNGTLNHLEKVVNILWDKEDMGQAIMTRKLLALDSYFYTNKLCKTAQGTQRMLRRRGVTKNNLLDIKTILLPICEDLHWTLVVIRPAYRTVAHMDSLTGEGSSRVTSRVMAWLCDVLEDKFKHEEWTMVQHEAPLQNNSHDCGIFTITNAICLTLELRPKESYSANEMPLLRRRIAGMLLNGGFFDDFDLRPFFKDP